MVHTWNKAKQYAGPAIKTVLVVACLVVVYQQVQNRALTLDAALEAAGSITWFIIPLMALLSLSSWLVESFKWQLLVKDFYGLRFRESVIHNLTAQAASFITPLRSGEYVLKTLYFPADQKKNILNRVLLGNVNQMLVTVVCGIGALFFYTLNFVDPYILLAGGLGMAVMGGMVYFLIGKKLNLPKATLSLWLPTFLLSLVRYVLFSACWWLVLYQIEPGLALLETITAVAVFYLVVSVLPLIQLLDIPVKITLAGLVFSAIVNNESAIATATLLVWATNTLLPTLLGCALLPGRELKALRA